MKKTNELPLKVTTLQEKVAEAIELAYRYGIVEGIERTQQTLEESFKRTTRLT